MLGYMLEAYSNDCLISELNAWILGLNYVVGGVLELQFSKYFASE